MDITQKPIILCGFMAVGKTTIGKKLAKKLSIPFYDTDDLLTQKYQMSITQMFQIGGEDYFREREHTIAKEVSSLSNCVISTGGGMLTFERNGEILKKSGIIICITRDFDTLYQILKNDSSRPMVYQKSKDEIKALYDSRVEKYKKYTHYFFENNTTTTDCVVNIIQKIAR